ncbi:MAG TPA: hypothetical protein DDX98_12475 [Bacteroidales bacterium]|jgi:hypothetical protein|nr:hypothetical protein [Bacteroidales bacterium]
MIHELQNFYLEQKEPLKSCYLALQGIIKDFDEHITEHWKYKLPFFYFKGKPFCYLWCDKKTNEPYIGVVKGDRINHPLLEQGNRKKMKIIRINPCADIPVESISEILHLAAEFY